MPRIVRERRFRHVGFRSWIVGALAPIPVMTATTRKSDE